MTYNIEQYQQEAFQLVAANAFPVIASQEDFGKAGDVLKIVKSRIAAIEVKRKSYTDPLLKQQKLIKADFDKGAEPYVKFAEELEEKMKAFWSQEKARVDALQLTLDAEASKNAGPDGALVPVVNAINSTRGNVANTNVRSVTKWKLIDINCVPTKFLAVNEKALNEHVKEGGACPSGIEYYEDLVLSSR